MPFAEDRLVERRDHFRAREDVFTLGNAHFGVREATKRRGAQKLVQDRRLHRENVGVNVVVVATRDVRTPVHPAIRREIIEKFGRNLERFGTEAILRKERKRVALILRGNDRERLLRAFVTLEIATDDETADIVRRKDHPVHFPVHEHVVARAHRSEAFAVLDDAFVQAGKELIDQSRANLRVFERTRTEIPNIHVRVLRDAVAVFVRRVAILTLRLFRRDLFKFRLLRFGRLTGEDAVTVFDHPFVVFANMIGEVIALFFSLRHNVDGGVFHDRSDIAVLGPFARVVDFIEGMERALIEVMA